LLDQPLRTITPMSGAHAFGFDAQLHGKSFRQVDVLMFRNRNGADLSDQRNQVLASGIAGCVERCSRQKVDGLHRHVEPNLLGPLNCLSDTNQYRRSGIYDHVPSVRRPSGHSAIFALEDRN
jgi:hypothetical protein